MSDSADFTAANLPFGVANRDGWPGPRVVVAIGDDAVDLVAVHRAGLLDDLDLPPATFATHSLNGLLGRGRPVVAAVRQRVGELLDEASLRVSRTELTMLLPVEVADFVDHYSSEHHARNLGRILRPGEEPLARPWLPAALLIVATPVSAELQVTSAVRSRVVSSE